MSVAGEEPPRRGTGAASQMGILLRMCAAMAIFVFAGYGLDRVLGTLPWVLLAGTLIGVVAMLLYLMRTAGGEKVRRR